MNKNHLTAPWAAAEKLLTGSVLLLALSGGAQIIGNHEAVYDPRGILQPWTSWRDALNREVNWYLKCPVENGYPRFVFMTFMDGNYKAIERKPSFIPATQNGMGIVSYLKWHDFTGRTDPRLVMAKPRPL